MDVKLVVQEANEKIAAVETLEDLSAVKVHYLGKKGVLTAMLKGLGKLSADQRPAAGQLINTAKQQIQDTLADKKARLDAQLLQAKLAQEALDITLPGCRANVGSAHPVTLAKIRLQNIFQRLGFTMVEGPEIEDDYHNFGALNIPEHHPARAMHDTFYLTNGYLLRTHTSSVQIRWLAKHQPPVKIIAMGRVYRCDSDMTHTPMFHQIEGLLIDKAVSFADLKGILQYLLQEFFEQDLKIRLRPSYFPFTEPSAEVDMECVHCRAAGCRVCKDTGWLEILGCGMVHPAVLKHCAVDSEKFRGWAFGIGIDRLAMLRFGIDDLRMMFENDLRFLGQF